MPGPNSAPNGDKGLIRGHAEERFYYCETCQRRREKEYFERYGIKAKLREILYPAREHDAKHKRLRTGKTKLNN